MPTLNHVWLWPNGGWTDRPWADTPEADSAARTAQRICASFTVALTKRQISSKKPSLQLQLYPGETQSVVDVRDTSSSEGMGAAISVPSGIHTLAPDARAEVMAEAILHATVLATRRFDLDVEAITDAMTEASATGFLWTTEGRWSSSPDRRRRARLCGRHNDDGFIRAWIEISDGGDVPDRASEEFTGLTTPTRFRNQLRTLEWIDSDTVSAGVNTDDTHFGRIDVEASTARTIALWKPRYSREVTAEDLLGYPEADPFDEDDDDDGGRPAEPTLPPLEIDFVPLEREPDVRPNDGDPRRAIPRPLVRTEPRRLFVRGRQLDVGPRSRAYRRRFDAVVDALGTDPSWRAWWTDAGLFDVQIAVNPDAAKHGLMVRVTDDHVVALIRRPQSTIPRGEAGRALATEDLARLVERIRDRAGSPTPPAFPS